MVTITAKLKSCELSKRSVFPLRDRSGIPPGEIASNDFQERIFHAFGGYNEFWKKVGIYLKAVTGDSCKFSLERFGREFITLRIHEPCKYRKGIKLEELANFFGISLSERSEDGAEPCSVSPVSSGGGALSEHTVRAERGRSAVARGGGCCE